MFLSFNRPLLEAANLKCAAVGRPELSEEVANLLAQELPLQYKWRVWEQLEGSALHGAREKEYNQATKPIIDISTVQEFWQAWNALPQPSELMSEKMMVRCSESGQEFVDGIMVFRDSVRPEWEDPANAKGGHYEIRFPWTTNPVELARIDEIWNTLVLGLLGGTLDRSALLTGVRLLDKVHDIRHGVPSRGFLRIEIWFMQCAPDVKAQLRQRIEKSIATKLSGETVDFPLQFIEKQHFRLKQGPSPPMPSPHNPNMSGLSGNSP